jgi:hypothetical protein
MSMQPAYDAITIRQGASFEDTIACQDDDGNPVDLTGCSALMKICATPSSSPVLTLSSANGSLVLGGIAGTIRRTVSPAQSAALVAGNYGADLFLTRTDGNVDCLVAGPVTVIDSFTA